MEDNLKQIPLSIKISGHLFFLVLFVFSLLFYKERHAFDAAHYLFEIITRNGFYIAHGRIIGFVSQILPLIGLFTNANLKSLMLLYSFGDVLYYYVLFLMAAYVVKSEAASISILLIVCLAVKFSFYCPVTELLQGMALVPLLYQLLVRANRFRYHLIPILLVLIIFSHPLLFILVGFVLVYFIVQQKSKYISRQNLFLAFTFLIITAAKFLLLDKYDYQKSFYPVVFDDYSNVNNVTDMDFIFSFFLVYLKENFIVAVIWIIAIGSLLITKKNIQAVVVFFAPVVFLFLIMVTHRFTAITNYSERMLLPFAGMIIISFSIGLQQIKSVFVKNILFVIIGIAICFRLLIIYDTSSLYSKRVEQIEELIRQAHRQNSSKCIADERNLEYLPYALTGWSYPLESLLLSSLNSKDSAVTIALKEEHFTRFEKRILADNEIYKTQDSIINYSMLNSNYFSMHAARYTFLNKSCVSVEINNTAITIHFADKESIKTDNGFCYLPTLILNQGNIICSNVDAGYQMQLDAISDKDSAYRDSRVIPFQTDVVSDLKQDLVFKNYGMKGKWKVNVSVIDQQKNLFGKSIISVVNVQ